MFERFTDRARKVMVLANQEARRLNHEYIGTEHVLLGLLKEGSGVGANVLKNLGVDLRKARLEVEKLVTAGPEMVTMGRLPQTPRAKRVIEYAVEEARNLGHNYVGTEHMLLGLVREQDGVAAQVLLNLGLRLENVRHAVGDLLGGSQLGERVRARADRSQAAPRDDSGPPPDRHALDGLRDAISGCLWRVEQLRELESDLVTAQELSVVAAEYDRAAELRDRVERLQAAVAALPDATPALIALADRLDEIRRDFPPDAP